MSLSPTFSSRLLGGLSVFSLALSLSACAPDLGSRPALLGKGAPGADRTFAAAPAGADIPADWWTGYQDPQLNALIAEALANAPSLAQAAARIDAAEAVVEQAGAVTVPTLGGQASAEMVRQSLNNGFPDQFKAFLPHGFHSQGRLSLDLQYQLDLFGKAKAALSSAAAQRDAAKADADAARLILTTGVAGAYADLARLYADRDAAAASLGVRNQSANLFNQRFTAGLENRGPAAAAEASAAVARGDIATIDGQIAAARNQIAALVGKGPDRGLDIARPSARLLNPTGLPATLSADLVGRRPDIVAAKTRVLAAGAAEDLARTDFYPDINLAAAAGLQSLPIAELLNHQSITSSFGPAISLPIFDRGARVSAYKSRRAAYEGAVADYDQAVINAFHQVGDALAARAAATAQLTEAQASVKAAQEAESIAQQRYDAGLVRYLDVLTAQDTRLAAQRRVADIQASALNLDVALIRALGGGYRAA
ncbi:MAG: hypothetical protein JWM33_3132 [Caulobacteraceae bacterium]|nr:hypothetical protein [Caulobacteraceae bacterium]